MPAINPYVSFKGNAKEAFDHYKSVFGGEFVTVMKWRDMPAGPGCEGMSEEDLDKVMHVSLPIGEGSVLMGADMPESMGRPLVAGNNFTIAAGTGSEEEANRVFAGLSDGGTVVMPLADTFWGSYFGMCTDRFGIQWMVSFERDKPGSGQ